MKTQIIFKISLGIDLTIIVRGIETNTVYNIAFSLKSGLKYFKAGFLNAKYSC